MAKESYYPYSFGSYIIFNRIIGDGCIARYQTKNCNELRNRFTCLTSFEKRNIRNEANTFKTIVHPGSECVWCTDKPCFENSPSQCESKTMINEVAEISNLDENGIEDCLKVPSMNIIDLYLHRDNRRRMGSIMIFYVFHAFRMVPHRC